MNDDPLVENLAIADVAPAPRGRAAALPDLMPTDGGAPSHAGAAARAPAGALSGAPDDPSRRAVLRPVAAAALAASAAGRAAAQPSGPARTPLKVGFVYVSPVAGIGWTPQQDVARRELELALAGRVATTFVENVPEGPDAERVIRDLASRGHGLIFGTSFGYMEPMLRVAREFPGVAFEQLSGWKTAPNLAVYNARFYEGRWLAGMLAGPCCKQLGKEWPTLKDRLALPELEFGIIAGGLSGGNPLVSGDDDLIVSVAECRLPGAKDFCLTSLHHGELMHHADSQKQVLRFLQVGSFSPPPPKSGQP